MITRKEKNREYTKKWYQNRIKRDPEYILYRKEYLRKWNKENGYKYTKGLSVRFKVLNRDSFTCQYCGQKAPNVELHVDHVIPRSKGGLSSIDNLVTACQDCNLGKSNHLLLTENNL